MPSKLAFDHIAIVAPTLEIGFDHVRDRIGIEVPPGGQHPKMGTHNRVMRLGQDEFLEIIAIDPDAAPPTHPRWFRLDTPRTEAPHIGNWIVRTPDIAAALDHFPPSCGLATPMSRGDMNWLISLPDDGSLPFDAAFPTILEWPTTPYPGSKMPDFGCSLHELIVEHPNAGIVEERLSGHLDDDRIRFEPSTRVALTAVIQTPDGLRTV